MTEEALRSSYTSRIPALTALGDWVTQTIISSLRDQLGTPDALSKFLQIPPKPRVKAIDSFLEKALIRKPKEDPLHDITDQVGVRFVVLLLEEIDKVGKIVESGPWAWQKDRDYEKERLEHPDYFAYQSDHYVIRPPADVVFDGITIPASTPCEIQIRTILQHAYAEMAHSSAYKPPVKLPEADQRLINRSLAKGSALIETTDDVFKEIKTKLREYNQHMTSLLARSSQIYETITGEAVPRSTTLGELVSDSYRALLKDVAPAQLEAWAKARPWLRECLLKKRVESVFYRDPVVILLGWLITDHETVIPKNWPVDSSYLEDFYLTMGTSTNGLF